MRISYTINKGFIMQRIDETFTLFDPETSVLFTLNESGGIIFECLKKKMTQKAILQKLTDHYEVSAKKAAADIEGLIAKLKKHRIIVEHVHE